MDVDKQRGRAAVSWNALMTHVHHDGSLFTVGGAYGADPRRTPDGRRFERVAIRVVWTQGQPPAAAVSGTRAAYER